ncbi:MAG: helix-turn-helix domain-containing protein [Lachnospiraceae bacterium]
MQTENDIRVLRDKYQMSRKEFAEYFEIPYRTVQDWELGNRSIQPYLYRLMAYKLATDAILKSKEL